MRNNLPQLPDTYYRVSVKALIYDDDGKLLVFQDENGEWELPGGGWNHDESLEDCLRREISEEMSIKNAQIGQIQCVYKCQQANDNYKVCVAVTTVIDKQKFVPSGDDLVAAKYVTKEEFLNLPFQFSEAGVKGVVDRIWPT